MWVPINLGNRSGSCSKMVGSRIAQLVTCHSRDVTRPSNERTHREHVLLQKHQLQTFQAVSSCCPCIKNIGPCKFMKVSLITALSSYQKAPDLFNFLRRVMRTILSVRPKCSHRCVSLKEFPLKPVEILKHAIGISNGLNRANLYENEITQNWFKHIAI